MSGVAPDALPLSPHVSSAATDRDDDFEFVTRNQFRLCVLAARHDVTVAFHRHALAGELHSFQQRGDRERIIETLRRAIDCELDHLQ